MSAPEIERLTTIGEHGRRNFLHPATARGPWTTRRRWIGVALMLVLLALPFVEIGGAPAIWLDVGARRFHVFGLHLGPSESYWLFFLVTGVGFTLVVLSALFGRVWCGYACPQTVFLEGLYRPIERLFEGSREQQLRLERAPLSVEKVLRKAGKHGAFALISILLAHLFLAYFVSPGALWGWMRRGPSAEPGVFIWAAAVSALMFGNFAWFREQMCIVICPYGRLQSALGDADTIVVGYDEKRGEPRGRLGTGARGDCVDCGRCVAVCPTGIDIRQGLQLECVGCTSCIDACDDVMLRLKRPPGLIRYDSQRGFSGQARRFWRPRLFIYLALMLAGVVAAAATAALRRPLDVTLTRQAGPPYVLDGDDVRNAFVLTADNPDSAVRTLRLSPSLPAGARTLVAAPVVAIEPQSVARFPIVIAAPRATGAFSFFLEVTDGGSGKTARLEARFAAPSAVPTR